MNDKNIALELCKCKEDFVYFVEKYLKLSNPKKDVTGWPSPSGREISSLKLHNFQKRYIKIIDAKRFVIGKKFRQGGFTTVALAWMLWKVLFHSCESDNGWRGMYCPKTDREAIAGRHVVKHFYDHLPDWLLELCPKYKDNNHELSLEGGNKISFFTPKAACGKAASFVFFDEAAFHPDMEQNWKMMYPVISTGGQVLVMSTPNGKDNWFYDTYIAAESHKNFFYVYYNEYSEHPDYKNPRWQARVKKNLGPRGYLQEILAEFFTNEDLENNIFLLPTDDGIKGGIGLTEKQETQVKEVAAQRQSFQRKLAKQMKEYSNWGKIDTEDPEVLKEVLGEEEFNQMGKMVGDDDVFDHKQHCWTSKYDLAGHCKPDRECKPDPDIYAGREEVVEKPPAIKKKMKFYETNDLRETEPPEDAKWFEGAGETTQECLQDMLRKQSKEIWGEQDKERLHGNMKDATHYKDGVLYSDRKVEQLTEDQVKSLFKRLHKNYDPDEVVHPEFDERDHPSCADEMIELAECTDGDWADDLKAQAMKQKSFYQAMEDNVNFEYLDPETLHLCGLLGVDNFKDHNENWGRPDLVVLHKVAQDSELPRNMNLQFLSGSLCVNTIPTIIKEEDVCDMFNGLQVMKSPQEACDDVVGVIRKKLKALFGKEKESDEYTEASHSE